MNTTTPIYEYKKIPFGYEAIPIVKEKVATLIPNKK